MAIHDTGKHLKSAGKWTFKAVVLKQGDNHIEKDETGFITYSKH